MKFDMSFSFPPIISVCCTAFIVNFFGIQKGVVLSERTRDLEELRLVADDFLVQYLELLELRAKVASLLFPLKALPPSSAERAQKSIDDPSIAARRATDGRLSAVSYDLSEAG